MLGSLGILFLIVMSLCVVLIFSVLGYALFYFIRDSERKYRDRHNIGKHND